MGNYTHYLIYAASSLAEQTYPLALLIDDTDASVSSIHFYGQAVWSSHRFFLGGGGKWIVEELGLLLLVFPAKIQKLRWHLDMMVWFGGQSLELIFVHQICSNGVFFVEDKTTYATQSFWLVDFQVRSTSPFAEALLSGSISNVKLGVVGFVLFTYESYIRNILYGIDPGTSKIKQAFYSKNLAKYFSTSPQQTSAKEPRDVVGASMTCNKHDVGATWGWTTHLFCLWIL